jgi:hypothetical protein
MKKTTLIIDGNPTQEERVVHELQKLCSAANREPEVDVTIQTEHVRETELSVETAFSGGGHE